MSKIPLDIHTHSQHSMDGSHSVAAMCTAAASLNIQVYAITDHCEINGFDKYNTAQTMACAYEEIEKIKKQYQGTMEVLNGIELGQPLQDMAKTTAVLQAYSFDFILGSLHNVMDRLDFYYFDYESEALDLDSELEAYFAELSKMIQWGGFDSAAHITYPFRYISQRYHRPFNIRRWDDHIDSIVKQIAEKGLALELNTSGLSQNPAYTLPEPRWIKRFLEHGGERLTLGSDAHAPEKVGNGILQAVHMAKDCGFRYLTYFKNRQAKYLSIKDYI